jgi:hypothetical protein
VGGFLFNQPLLKPPYGKELIMNETTKNDQPKKKMGRPPKNRNIVLFHSGNKIKAFNTDLHITAPATAKDIGNGAKVYAGLCFDWVNWGHKVPEAGFYNAATHTPLRSASDPVDENTMKALEWEYKNCPTLRKVMNACEELFRARKPKGPIVLEGSWWMRLLSEIFISDAGMEGISRSRFERPYGRVWASVNVLPTRGPGYNYTEESWYSVVNMKRAPIFCVKVTGEERGGMSAWEPEDLANAILCSLWQQKGVDSCQADVPKSEATATPSPVDPAIAAAHIARIVGLKTKEQVLSEHATPPPLPPVASEEAPASVLPSEDTPPPESHPDAVSDDVAFMQDKAKILLNNSTYGAFGKQTEPAPEPTVLTEADVALSSTAIPEATATDNARTWWAIKQTLISMKGLTTSRDLQAPAPLSRILETVVSHEATARLTAECRAIGDKKARNEYKADNMHVFYPSCVFAGRAGGSKKENVTGYTGIACLDFDGMKTFAEAEDTRDNLFMEFPEILFAAVSASGLGVYALVILDFDGTEAGYKAALSSCMETFEAKGYMPDAGCADATRARYMSSDPDALSRPDSYIARAFSAGEEGAFILPATMLRSVWTNSGRKKKGAGKLYLEEALSRIETAPEGSKDTTLTSVMGSVARLIRNYGMDSAKVYDQVRKVAAACSYDTRKTEDKIRRLGVKNEGGML